MSTDGASGRVAVITGGFGALGQALPASTANFIARAIRTGFRFRDRGVASGTATESVNNHAVPRQFGYKNHLRVIY